MADTAMRFGLVGNPEKYEMRDVAVRLASLVAARGSTLVADADLADVLKDRCSCVPERELGACDVVFALGGDGTVLKAVHRVGFRGVPVLGINLGTLGFLAEVPVEQMEAALDEVLRGAVVREGRRAIVATLPDGTEVPALNEVVVGKRDASRMIGLDVHADGKFLNTYVADGLIVATPTGSTAYSLSAGGPIVSPDSTVLVITPLAPHALTARPLVVPDAAVITMHVTSQRASASLAADGRDHPLPAGATVTVRRAPSPVVFLRRAGVSHFDVLRAKLLWGRDPRGGPGKGGR